MSFPRRPRVSRSYLVRTLAYLLLLLPLTLLLAGGMLYMGGVEARKILADQKLWESGRPVKAPLVEGEETSRRFVFHEYDLQVAYENEAGRHEATVEFNTIGGEVDTDVPVEVHVDPNDAGRMVTSWQIQTKNSRWAYVLLFAAVAALIGGYVVLEGIRVSRVLRILFAVDDRTPVRAVRVVRSAANTNAPAGKRTWKIEVAPVSVPGAAPSGAMVASHVREQDGGPFYVDAQQGLVLVAVHERWPSHPIVIAANGAPFDLSPDELESTAQKVSSGG